MTAWEPEEGREAQELLIWIDERLGDTPKGRAAQEIVLHMILGLPLDRPGEGGTTADRAA